MDELSAMVSDSCLSEASVFKDFFGDDIFAERPELWTDQENQLSEYMAKLSSKINEGIKEILLPSNPNGIDDKG
jgi:hypothetical protein